VLTNAAQFRSPPPYSAPTNAAAVLTAAYAADVNEVRDILKDDETHSRVRIDYVPSLGDWKTAWDFIHFEGFLGHKMTMQFTWQGCDSILAAPLVLDMVRLTELSMRRGERGPMTQLSPYFKSPLGVSDQDLHAQFHAMMDYFERLGVKPP